MFTLVEKCTIVIIMMLGNIIKKCIFIIIFTEEQIDSLT